MLGSLLIGRSLKPAETADCVRGAIKSLEETVDPGEFKDRRCGWRD
jgi:hypothetical protein